LLSSLIIAAIPHTEPWGFNTALVMTICNSVTVAVGRVGFAHQLHRVINPSGGKDLPIGKPDLLGNFSLPELLATLSFGHILGVGIVLGLTNIGVI
jgi:photosystem I subunit X